MSEGPSPTCTPGTTLSATCPLFQADSGKDKGSTVQVGFTGHIYIYRSCSNFWHFISIARHDCHHVMKPIYLLHWQMVIKPAVNGMSNRECQKNARIKAAQELK